MFTDNRIDYYTLSKDNLDKIIEDAKSQQRHEDLEWFKRILAINTNCSFDYVVPELAVAWELYLNDLESSGKCIANDVKSNLGPKGYMHHLASMGYHFAFERMKDV